LRAASEQAAPLGAVLTYSETSGDKSEMPLSTRSRLKSFATVAIATAFLAACSTAGEKNMTRPTGKRSKEYFSEAEYGVKASPRVTNKRSRLPRGGGRDQVGKPYKVAGKWYYPKEDKRYKKVGAASWYGDAFHGRLTANGEIYDMTHLTAAHPTMPLPSYARVTNVKNGASVIVRVNDRGPYARGRIIDLSKRAAELLDYTQTGVAKVKVEYVGRAPLDGRDDSYLMASYRPGKSIENDGLPTGVMVAMNGSTPTYRPRGSGIQKVFAPEPVVASAGLEPVGVAPVAYSPAELPAFGPISPDRPGIDLWPQQDQQVAALMSYADSRVRHAAAPFDALTAGLSEEQLASWRRQNPEAASGRDDYVAAGTFADRAQAERIASLLEGSGRISVERSQDGGGTWYSVEVRSNGTLSLDDILRAAWDSGAPDALVVRD
jgi:rare lipoprotein A